MNLSPLLKPLSNWKTTGNASVDAVAEAVWQHRKSARPLRSISLKPGAYEMFILFLLKTHGVESILNEKGDVAAPIEFDGVQILRGSKLQLYNMSFDYFPSGMKQAEAWREQKESTGHYPEHITSKN